MRYYVRRQRTGQFLLSKRESPPNTAQKKTTVGVALLCVTFDLSLPCFPSSSSFPGPNPTIDRIACERASDRARRVIKCCHCWITVSSIWYPYFFIERSMLSQHRATIVCPHVAEVLRSFCIRIAKCPASLSCHMRCNFFLHLNFANAHVYDHTTIIFIDNKGSTE